MALRQGRYGVSLPGRKPLTGVLECPEDTPHPPHPRKLKTERTDPFGSS